MLSGDREAGCFREEAGCFREAAALHSDHLRQVPLYNDNNYNIDAANTTPYTYTIIILDIRECTHVYMHVGAHVGSPKNGGGEGSGQNDCRCVRRRHQATIAGVCSRYTGMEFSRNESVFKMDPERL